MSICIYETIEKLISKYCDIILIPKKNMEFFFKNKKIVFDQFSSLENYFQKSLNNNKIIIKEKFIQNFIFQETPQLTKIFSINIDKPTHELFSKFIQYIDSIIKIENIYFFYKKQKLNIYEKINVENYFNKFLLNLKNNDDIIIDVKIEKKFMFESEQNYFSEEIIIDINESVEMLLYKYAKKTNLIKNIDKLYFFIDKKRIEFHEKNILLEIILENIYLMRI